MKILVISNGASYGAPRVLVNTCKALKRQGCEFKFVLLRDGVFRNEYEAWGK